MIDYKELTIKQKIGQLIVCGFVGTDYSEHARTLIEDYKVGNIIIFNRNYRSANQMKKLDRELHEKIMENSSWVPLIAIDQEGGMVTRMMKDVTFPPSHMTSSATSIKHAPYEAGKAIGRDMIMLGMNWDYAPCLDINPDLSSNNHNVRSYSSNPEACGKYAREFMDGLKEYGVISCAKHFPGCGDDVVDSHLELPIVTASEDRFYNFILKPFKMNIDVPSVMTTHTIFTTVDPEYPATLSKAVLQGILRKDLGYKGIIVSDAVEMKAIADHFGIGEGAALGLIAGCDMVLCCHELDEQKACFEKVYEAYEKGLLTEEMIDEKLARIKKFKEGTIPYLEKYFYNDNNDYQADLDTIAKIQEIVDNSITLVKGNIPKVKRNTLIIAPVASVASQAEHVLDERDLAIELKKHFNNTILKNEETNKFKELAIKESAKADEVIIINYDGNRSKIQQEIINEVIKMKKEKAYIISLKGPFDAPLFNNMENYIVMYEYTPNSIRSIIKFLKGQISTNGRLPNSYL